MPPAVCWIINGYKAGSIEKLTVRCRVKLFTRRTGISIFIDQLDTVSQSNRYGIPGTRFSAGYAVQCNTDPKS